jgi:hypothetical protein
LYEIELPDLEPRLQRRYENLVRQHLAAKTELAAGLRAMSETKGSFAATQGAWRFFRNPHVTLPGLMGPLLGHARRAIATECKDVVLAIHDWSALGFANHESKSDRVPLRTKRPVGYELLTGLLLSDRTGDPLGPTHQELTAADGVLSTRSNRRLPPRSHLDALTLAMAHLGRLELGKPVVHIIDAEADSVGHLRRWEAKKERFVTRGDDIRWVKWKGQECQVATIWPQLVFKLSGEVQYHGRAAQQYVAETNLTLHRPAREHRIINGRHVHRTRQGRPLELRLVVSEIRDQSGQVLAQWLLWTNVSGVSAQTIALWYYWRWRIESYFKLLKRAGQQIEQWQQTSAPAIARRLLVAAMACVVVWDLARSTTPAASQARSLLVRLSGRLMKRGVEFTQPALLAGMWVLLAMLETLEEYSHEELRQLAAQFLPLPPMESG